MRYIYFILTILFLCNCNTSICYSPTQKGTLSNEIMKKVANQVNNETGLIPCGTGGQAMDEIKMLALAFDCHEQLNIDSARKLLITVLEKFKSEINSDSRIRQYLTNYPFEPKNIEIRIFIKNKNRSNLGKNKLCIISAINGILEYEIYTPDGFNLETIHEESYEEAIQKLNEGNMHEPNRQLQETI